MMVRFGQDFEVPGGFLQRVSVQNVLDWFIKGLHIFVLRGQPKWSKFSPFAGNCRNVGPHHFQNVCARM